MVLGLAVFADAQKAILSGNVYDALGALIIGAKVTATNESGEKFEAVTNDKGIYILNLPFNSHSSNLKYKIAKYDILVEQKHFENFLLKDFKFIPSPKNKIHLDFGLEIQKNTNIVILNACG